MKLASRDSVLLPFFFGKPRFFGKAWGFRNVARILAFSVVFVGSFVGDPRAATVEKASSSLFEDAVSNYEDREYKTAIIQLKNILRENPSDLPARILIGRTYLKIGDPVSAEKELRRARAGGGDEELLIVPLVSTILMQRRYDEVINDFALGGRSAEVEAGLQIVRGQAFLATRSLLHAVEAFERAEELRPDAAITRIGLARYQMLRADLELATDLIEEAISLEPENFYAWAVKGKIFRRKGRPKIALSAFDKALALEADDIPSRIGRASVLVELGRLADASPDISHILEIQPRNPNALYLKAIQRGQEGDKTQYFQYLQETDLILRSLSPQDFKADPSLYLLSGLVNRAVKNYPDAYSALKTFVDIEPFHAGARTLLGGLLLRRGNRREALTMLQVARGLSPNDPSMLRQLGIALIRNQRYREAGEVFQEALAQSPSDQSIKTFLALSRLRSGDRDEAVSGLKSAFSGDSKAVRPGLTLALILLRERKFKEAVDLAKEISSRIPDDPTPYNIMGAAKWGLGKAAEARVDLEKALSLNPNYHDAQNNLALIDLREGKVEAAKARYKTMIGQDGAGVAPLLALASIAKRAGDFQGVISFLSKAKEQDRSNKEVQLELIVTHQLVGDIDSARRDAKKLRQRFPDDLAVLERLGLVELDDGKLKVAAAIFNRMRGMMGGSDPRLSPVAQYLIRSSDLVGAHKALLKAATFDSKNIPARAALISLETRMGRFKKALSRANGLRNAYPNQPIGHSLRGDVMMQLKRYDEAAVSYAAGLRIQESGTLLVKLYFARKKAESGNLPIERLKRWVDANPKDVRSRHALGGAYINAKKHKDAIQQFEVLYKAAPKDVIALNNLAWLYYEVKDSRALSYAERAYDLAPNQPQTLDTYGWILVQQGDVEEGLRLLRNAYSRSSRNLSIRYHLAFALNQRGNKREALRHLKEVVKSKKGDETIEKAKRLLAEIEA